MMSTSSEYVCEKPLIDTSTSVIVPVSPETTQFDGYGIPTPESGIVIAPPLQPPAVAVAEAEAAAVAAAAEAAVAEAEAAEVAGRPAARRDRQRPAVDAAHVAAQVVLHPQRPRPVRAQPVEGRQVDVRRLARGRGREHVAGCRPVRRPPRAGTDHGRVRQLVGGLVVQHEVEADGAVRSARVRHHGCVRRRRRVGEHDVDIVRVRVREAVDRHVDVGDRPRQPGDDTVRRIRAPHSRTRDRDCPTAAAARRRWRRWRRWRWQVVEVVLRPPG